jgi:hypothetical protein
VRVADRVSQVWWWTFHSFVFPTVPALVFLVANMRQLAVPASEAARSVAALALCNLVLLAVLTPLRGLNASAVTLSSFYIIVSFYTIGYRIFTSLTPPFPEWLLAGAYVLCAAAGAAWLGAPRQGADKRYQMLNVAAATLIVVCGIMIANESTAWAARRWSAVTSKLVAEAPAPALTPPSPPDIYYIVLDGFGRPDILRDRYGVDLASGLVRLRELGWSLPTSSRTNYSQTYLSLASALNGTYLDPVAAVMRDSRDRRALHDIIQRSGPVTALKRRGYRLRMVGSNTSVTQTHAQADDCDCRSAGLNEFENGLLTITPFRVLPLYGPTFGSHYEAVVSAFDLVAEERPDSHPQITLAHVIMPHPPFVLDADGEPIIIRGPLVYGDGDHFAGSAADYTTGYANQARYTMRQLVRFAEWIGTRKRHAIVVVHGDHGPGSGYSHRSLAETDVAERFPIFMGVRLDAPDVSVPDDLSPVNLFRVIFNSRFGSDDELLPNHSYYSTWAAPYELTEVPERQALTSP